MPEISRLSGNTDWIELDFVERQRTPGFAMRLGIQMHIAGLSLLNTISILRGWVSNALELPLTSGYRRPIYSPTVEQARITLRLMKLGFESTISNTGCMLLSIPKQTNSFMFGSLTRIQPISPKSS